MENLLVSRIGRRSDLVRINLLTEILDVCENNISWLSVELMVLAATDGGNVRCNAGIDDDILLTAVVVNRNTLDDLETVT